jgi:hypothetical protein
VLKVERVLAALTVAFAAAIIVAVASGALSLPLEPGDLVSLGQGLGQTPASVPLQDNPEPPIVATPKIPCGPGSNSIAGLDDGVDGRVPAAAINSPRSANGYTCNLTVVGHQGSSGGFKVWRYIDPAGHECAYYDTSLLFPTNAVSLIGPPSTGVAVLDMTDPAHSVQTATLNDIVMDSPHESLSLNTKRGLLGAVLGNPAFHPGFVSVYSLSQDCRHPVLDFTLPLARFGHEGNFAPDGNTLYAAGTGANTVTAIDVSNPTQPHVLWQGNIGSHGLTLSDDGNRAYLADATGGQLTILDTSQIQARKPIPQAFEVSRLTWSNVTIPQNAMPMTINGHHYLLEFDEYAFRTAQPPAPANTVGAGRIINIDNERHPYIVSDLRLQVDQPAEHAAAASGDPGTIDPAQGYAAHYCGIPSEVDPQIVACSFIASGLRVFDIRDPVRPKEIGYFVSPPKANSENGSDKSNFAMSKPAFAPERREIWYTDGTTGFYVLRVPASLWPNPTAVSGQSCLAASGRIHGRHIGPVALGERRAALRDALPTYSTRNRRSWDFYCLTGGGIRAAFRHNRVVWALSANKRYRFDGIGPGTRLPVAARRLHIGRGYKVGLNTWHIASGRSANGIFKVRHGEIQEVGIINKTLTTTRASARKLLQSLP